MVLANVVGGEGFVLFFRVVVLCCVSWLVWLVGVECLSWCGVWLGLVALARK